MGAACSSCGAAIEWGVSAKGKRVPLDAKPITIVVGCMLDAPGLRRVSGVTDAGVWLQGWPTSNPAVVEAQEMGARHGFPLEVVTVFVSHFTTCPNAASHSKPKGSK
jgi:hypothetical protein